MLSCRMLLSVLPKRFQSGPYINSLNPYNMTDLLSSALDAYKVTDYDDDYNSDSEFDSIYENRLQLNALLRNTIAQFSEYKGFPYIAGDIVRYPDMCMVYGDIPGPPLALIKRCPLEPYEELNPEDILVFRKPTSNWQPPEDNKDVLDSPTYYIYQNILRMASSNMYPNTDESWKLKKWRLRGTGDLTMKQFLDCFDNRPIGDDAYVLKRFRNFYHAFKEAVQRGWSDTKGRIGFREFLQAANHVCDSHSPNQRVELSTGSGGEGIGEYTSSGGEGIGEYTNMVAMRKVQLSAPKYTEKSEEELRNPLVWFNQPVQNCDPWIIEAFNPDVVMFGREYKMPDDLDEWTGNMYLVGEIKSQNPDMRKMKDRALTQALKFNKDVSQSAVITMCPTAAAFISISEDNGFIDVKMKEYTMADGMVDPAGSYQELFHDLVLYLYNTCYVE